MNEYMMNTHPEFVTIVSMVKGTRKMTGITGAIGKINSSHVYRMSFVSDRSELVKVELK